MLVAEHSAVFVATVINNQNAQIQLNEDSNAQELRSINFQWKIRRTNTSINCPTLCGKPIDEPPIIIQKRFLKVDGLYRQSYQHSNDQIGKPQ